MKTNSNEITFARTKRTEPTVAFSLVKTLLVSAFNVISIKLLFMIGMQTKFPFYILI